MNNDKAYQDYLDALDNCIEISKKRAYGLVDGILTIDERHTLDRKYWRAALLCDAKRAAWMEIRDAERAKEDQ